MLAGHLRGLEGVDATKTVRRMDPRGGRIGETACPGHGSRRERRWVPLSGHGDQGLMEKGDVPGLGTLLPRQMSGHGRDQQDGRDPDDEISRGRGDRGDQDVARHHHGHDRRVDGLAERGRCERNDEQVDEIEVARVGPGQVEQESDEGQDGPHPRVEEELADPVGHEPTPGDDVHGRVEPDGHRDEEPDVRVMGALSVHGMEGRGREDGEERGPAHPEGGSDHPQAGPGEHEPLFGGHGASCRARHK